MTRLFCSRVLDKPTNRYIYINFTCSDEVPAPEVEFTDQAIIRQSLYQDLNKDDYKIPLKLSPMFWKEDGQSSQRDGPLEQCERAYVIMAVINKKFALRKVTTSEIIRHYLIMVTMSCIVDQFNDGVGVDPKRVQRLGHNLDLYYDKYEVLESQIAVEHSKDLVSNRVLVIDEEQSEYSARTKSSSQSEADPLYELHLRPAMGLLTCSFETGRPPISISFNDDRLKVKLFDFKTIDIHLPINIDLKEPMKYKFDDKLNLMRIVFKVEEPPISSTLF